MSPHVTLNTVKGVVREFDLLHTEEAEILRELSDQGVIHVRRIKVRREGELINTITLILTFGTPDLPTHIICGYLRVPVNPYIPNPLRCFKCQRFGHHRDTCKKDAICARCGQAGHTDDKACEAPARCVNCKGHHNAYSKECSEWKK